MTEQLSIIAVISALLGVSVAALMWSLRLPIERAFRRDVAWLEASIWRFTPEPFNARPYVLGFYIGTVVVTLLAVIILPFKPAAMIFVLLGLWVPRVMLERRWQKRRKAIDEQLPAAVLQMGQNVAAGLTLAQAVERLSERTAEPIATEFRVMSNYWKGGADLRATLEEAKRRLRLPNFTLFASALLINQRLGGNVVETLERLGKSLESIDRMRREVYSATSEGRTNIKVLAAAPFLMLGMVALMDWEAMKMLFTTNVGWILLTIAGLLTAAGTLWAWAIVNTDV